VLLNQQFCVERSIPFVPSFERIRWIRAPDSGTRQVVILQAHGSGFKLAGSGPLSRQSYLNPYPKQCFDGFAVHRKITCCHPLASTKASRSIGGCRFRKLGFPTTLQPAGNNRNSAFKCECLACWWLFLTPRRLRRFPVIGSCFQSKLSSSAEIQTSRPPN
jgi:hypothetical protein